MSEKSGGDRGVLDTNMAGLVRLHARKDTPVYPHPHTDTHACTHNYPRARTHAHTHTHTEKYVYLLLYQGNNGFVNAPHCYVIHTLPVLLLATEVRM